MEKYFKSVGTLGFRISELHNIIPPYKLVKYDLNSEALVIFFSSMLPLYVTAFYIHRSFA